MGLCIVLGDGGVVLWSGMRFSWWWVLDGCGWFDGVDCGVLRGGLLVGDGGRRGGGEWGVWGRGEVGFEGRGESRGFGGEVGSRRVEEGLFGRGNLAWLGFWVWFFWRGMIFEGVLFVGERLVG